MRLALALALVLALAGCSGGAARLLLGGGPNVAANVQAGKTNSQTIGTTRIADQRLVRPQARTIEQSAGDTLARVERVERLEVRQEAPPWVWLLAIAGWLLPSPGEIAHLVRGLFQKRKK